MSDKQSARYGRQMSRDLKDFFRSVRLGDVSSIRHSIEGQGINVNTTDAWDNTPLKGNHFFDGHPGAVKYLLQKGARYDTNSVDSQRCFLSSLTNDIREVLKQYECSLIVESTDLKYVEYLQQLYERQPGYDIELEIQGQLYLAHRCILSVRCRYFADQFQNNTNDRIALSHKLMCTDVFGPMLRFIYTGRLDIEKRQREKAIALAKFLQFNSLAEILEKDKSLLMIRHQQLLKELKKDFGCLVTAAVSPSTADPAENEACGLDVKTYPDIVFDVQGHSFKCHKIFFYGRSEFFREMLIDKEDEQPPAYGDYLPSIKLDDITADVFVQIISFLYIEEYEVTKDTCIPLIRASTQFVLPVIKKKCLEEISKYIYPSNVLDIYQSSVELDMPRLKNSCSKYMADELEQMITFPEFEMFIRQQLSPLMNEGTAFDQIPFFMDFQYYLRHDCSTWDEQKAANEKLQKLNYLLTHKIGLDVSIPLFQISDTRPKPVIVLSKEEVRRRNMEKRNTNSCIIM
ncbi:ABTB1 [Mytilus coruscus]|uniref:ABTB1 n=1 Tax=Mytilus coruscus TaxID=42192 RepID=A0A6J8CVS3_MYTCO|nr:ABTB1 [Mytilus coruscus]